jgi:hypothetical protein
MSADPIATPDELAALKKFVGRTTVKDAAKAFRSSPAQVQQPTPKYTKKKEGKEKNAVRTLTMAQASRAALERHAEVVVKPLENARRILVAHIVLLDGSGKTADEISATMRGAGYPCPVNTVKMTLGRWARLRGRTANLPERLGLAASSQGVDPEPTAWASLSQEAFEENVFGSDEVWKGAAHHLFSREESPPNVDEQPNDTIVADPMVPVVLGGPDDPVFVWGKDQGRLPPAEYRVIRALVKAREERKRLHTDSLRNATKDEQGHAVDDAVGALERLLKRKGSDWGSVIDMAGVPGRGYGLKDWPPTPTQKNPISRPRRPRGG